MFLYIYNFKGLTIHFRKCTFHRLLKQLLSGVPLLLYKEIQNTKRVKGSLIRVNMEISIQSLIPPSWYFHHEVGGRKTANQKELGFGYKRKKESYAQDPI